MNDKCDQLLERPLPNSAEAERAILGAIILDNGLISQAIELLRAEDFYVPSHRRIFVAMIALFERGSEISPILISEELRRDNLLESVGGISFISNLILGLPHFANITHYAEIVCEKSWSRQYIKECFRSAGEALEEDSNPEIIRERHSQNVLALHSPTTDASEHSPLISSFAEFMNRDFEDGEQIAWHACRGEIVLVQSVTNHGKSTLIRNSAIALASGGEFQPIIEKGQPRRVLLLNLEGSGGRFQADLRVMTRDFPHEEIKLVYENLFPVHRPLLRDGQLSLSRHMKLLEREARKYQIDVIIIDTASKAFTIRNENDNAEIGNHVMKSLDDLACRLNCLIVLVHHIGKAKGEDGAVREQAHRGRGASAWGDFSASIFNLVADPHDQGRVTLTCGKRKNGENYEQVLRLNRESRCFETSSEKPAKLITNDDLVLEAMRGLGRSEMRTAEIEAALTGRVKLRTLMDCLGRLADRGLASSPKRGWWALVQIVQPTIGSCTTCTNDNGDDKAAINNSLQEKAVLSPALSNNGHHRACIGSQRRRRAIA